MATNFRVPTLMPVAEFTKAGTGSPPAQVEHEVFVMRGKVVATGAYAVWQSLDAPDLNHPDGDPVTDVTGVSKATLLV